jgi:hypothetical protein
MQEQPIGAERHRDSNLSEDIEAEAAVLRQLFSFGHPVTLEELVRYFVALNSDSRVFGQQDEIERAVSELVANGLVIHTTDHLVLPTRAAHKFADLAEFP